MSKSVPTGLYKRVMVAFLLLAAGLSVTLPAHQSTAATPGATAQNVPKLASARLTPPPPGAPAGRFSAWEPDRPAALSPNDAEVVSARTERSDQWQRSDGSVLVRQFAWPRYYKTASGLAPIDPTLVAVAGDPGWFESAANTWKVRFGPVGSAGGFEQISEGPAALGFSAVGAASVPPVVSGSTVTYVGLWPGVDARYTVSAVGVDEALVLHSATAQPGAFDVVGATVSTVPSGGLALRSGGLSWTVPPVTVTTARSAVRPSVAGAGFTVAQLSVRPPGSRVGVTVADSWLRSLESSAFPVTIDPSVVATEHASYGFSQSQSNATTSTIQIGTDSATQTWFAQAAIPVPPPVTAAAPPGRPWQLATAYLSVTDASQGVAAHVYGIPTYGRQDGATSLFDYFGGEVAPWVRAHGASTFEFMAEPGAALATINPSINYAYYEAPPATTISSPTSGSTITSLTPTLTAAPTADNDPNDYPIYYDFQITDIPYAGAGNVADSGWMPANTGTGGCGSPCAWTVPAGALRDGVQYYASVLVDINAPWDPTSPYYVTPAAALAPVIFTVKERLGAGGPSPTDTVGSTPSGTSTPAAGTPSPGLIPASVAVNLVTGNLSAQVSTPSMSTLSGTAGVNLAYNSTMTDVRKGGGGHGLIGTYLADNGSHQLNGKMLLSRLDPTPTYTTEGGNPAFAQGSTSSVPMATSWTGYLTLPAGTWQLGGLQSGGGMRVLVTPSGASAPTDTYDTWSGGSNSIAAYGSTSWPGNATYAIEVDYWTTGSTTDREALWALNTASASSNTSAYQQPVGSSWLTTTVPGLPTGWSMSAGTMTQAWTHLTDLGDQVVLTSASGATATFTQNGGIGPGTRYQPPPGDEDTLTADTTGTSTTGAFTLATSNNWLYTFNADGSVASITTIADDRTPASLRYTYTGNPIELTGITDPVPNRTISLHYGRDAACPVTTTTGMLCSVANWDGTTTVVQYNPNGQLAQVTAAYGTTAAQSSQFAYDANGDLAGIEDPIAYAAEAAGRAGEGTACVPASATTPCPLLTQIVYDNAGRVASVTQPRPVEGAMRTVRTYCYAGNTTSPCANAAAGITQVQLSGISPATGYASQVTYDTKSRVTSITTSTDQTSTTAWDSLDRPIVDVGPTGQQTTTVYDTNSNITDTYGPAPRACFNPPAATTGPNLPVTNPAGTAGCGITAVPNTHHGFDEGLTGLAATFWNTPDMTGPAVMHTTGLAGAAPNGYTRECGVGGFCGQWTTSPAGCPQVTNAPVCGNGQSGDFQWSARFTGLVTAPSANYNWLDVQTNTLANVYVDGSWWGQADSSDGQGSGYYGTYPYTSGFSMYQSLTQGSHTIEIDLFGTTNPGTYNAIGIATTANSQPINFTPLPYNSTNPNYGLPTSATDPDGKTTSIRYTDGGTDPVYGLATATVADPTGLNLVTSATYEAPGAGWLRKLTSTLPGDQTSANSSRYAYYTGTAAPLDDPTTGQPACELPAGTNEAGRLEQLTDPNPGGNGQPRAQQYVYDNAGRQIGRRVGPANTITTQPWACTTYDATGRTLRQSWPAINAAPARSLTYHYSVSGNPLVASVSDDTTAATVTATMDLLGRMVSYTDSIGDTTTQTYDQAGRPQTTTTTTLDNRTLTTTSAYDPPTGLPTTTTVNGAILATASYDGYARLHSVSYANNTTATIGYDTTGTGGANAIAYASTASGAFVAGDTISRDPAGRTTNESVDTGTTLVDAAPAGQPDFAYDSAGRLTKAVLIGQIDSYAYTSDTCGNTGAGANTNRTAATISTASGTTVTNSCYNAADQLTRVSSPTGTITTSYDSHGNQTTDGATAYTWTADDQLAGTTNTAGQPITYARDPLDRITARTDSLGTVTYGYNGFTDSPTLTYVNNTLTQQTASLPGGVNATINPTTNTTVWGYSNLQGHTITTSDNNGAPSGTTVVYDPWGSQYATQQTGSTSTPTAGHVLAGGLQPSAYTTLGKLTESAGMSSLIMMGARGFSPTEARFISTDPVAGGCANPYTYAFGDPLNGGDFTGQADCERHHIVPRNLDAGGLGASARRILATAGLTVEDPSNIVLISTAGHRTGDSRVHGTAAENIQYLQWVNANLQAGGKDAAGVRASLDNMAAQLEAAYPCGGSNGGGTNVAPWVIGGAALLGAGLLTFGVADVLAGVGVAVALL